MSAPLLGRRASGDVRGQSMVEFALIVPIFVLLIVGLFDVGRAVYAYSTLNNAAREGGRQAVVDQTESHIQERAAAHAVALGVEPGDVIVDWRLRTSPDEPDSCDGYVGQDQVYNCVAVIQVPYQYNAATPVISSLLGTLQLLGEARFPVEFNCHEPTKPQCPVAQ